MNASISRRWRKNTDAGGSDSSNSFTSHSKPQTTSICSACVLLLVAVLVLFCMFGGSASHTSAFKAKVVPALTLRYHRSTNAFRHRADLEKDVDGTDEPSKNATANGLHRTEPTELGILETLPILRDVYGKYMQKVLHIGRDSCDIVATLVQGEGVEAWGIEPVDIEDPSAVCTNLIKKGLVRVGEVHRTLPYRSKTFSLVLASDTLEHLTSRQLNRTLPELIRLTEHALVVIISNQASSHESIAARQMQAALKPVKHHNRTWWTRRFETAGLEENTEITKQFDSLCEQRSYKFSDYHVFHFLVEPLD